MLSTSVVRETPTTTPAEVRRPAVTLGTSHGHTGHQRDSPVYRQYFFSTECGCEEKPFRPPRRRLFFPTCDPCHSADFVFLTLVFGSDSSLSSAVDFDFGSLSDTLCVLRFRFFIGCTSRQLPWLEARRLEIRYGNAYCRTAHIGHSGAASPKRCTASTRIAFLNGGVDRPS